MIRRTVPLVAALLLTVVASTALAQTEDPAAAKQTYWTRPLASFTMHKAAVLSLAFNPQDSGTFASGSRDMSERDMSMIRFWNLKGELLRTATPTFGSVSLLRWSPDGAFLLSMSQNLYDKQQLALRQPPRVLLWDPARPRWIKWIDRGQLNEVLAFDFSPDGKNFVMGGKEKAVELWALDLDHHKIVVQRIFLGHLTHISAVAFSPDSTRLASGSMDRTIKLWEHNKVVQQLLRTLEGHTGSVNALAWTPDGNTLVSGSSDRTLKVWNVADGACTHTLEGHTGSVNAIAITPDGKYVLSVSNDGTLKVWQLPAGKLLHSVSAHTGPIQALSLSGDGKLLLTGGDDTLVRLWSVGTYTGQP